MQKSLPARESITPDTPLRLSVAAALAYPDGSMTANGLRRDPSARCPMRGEPNQEKQT